MAFKQFATAVEKQQIREHVAHTAMLNRAKNILSLSAETFASEVAILKANQNTYHIDCVDYGYNTFVEAKQNLKNIPKRYSRKMTLMLDNIFNMDFGNYDFIFLDLCGNLCPKTITNLISCCQNFHGTIFVTLSEGQEFHLKQFGVNTLDELRNFRTKGFANLLKKFAKMKQVGNIIKYSNKSENKQAKPMLLYQFVRK